MGFFTSFTTGALNRRAEVQDQQYDETQERMKAWRETIMRGAPLIAQQREKNSQWNEAYNLAIRAGATDAMARRHAMNPSEESWKEMISAVNSVRYSGGLKRDSGKVVAPSGAPNRAPSADNGYGTVPAAEEPMEEITITADRTDPGMTAAPAFGPTDTLGPSQPPSTVGVTAPVDFNRKTSFLDAILGRRPVEVQNAEIFRRLGSEMGTSGEAVQGQYNTIMSGNFDFKPPTTPNDGLGVYSGNDPVEMEAKAGELISRLNFSSSANMQAFRNAWMKAAMDNDHEAMANAYQYAMDDEAKAKLTVRNAQRGQSTDNQVINNAGDAVGKMLGGKWNVDAYGKGTFDFGATAGKDGAIFSQVSGSVQGDVLTQIQDQFGDDPADVPKNVYDKYAALYTVARVHRRWAQTPLSGRGELEAIQRKAAQLAKEYSISQEEVNQAIENMRTAGRM